MQKFGYYCDMLLELGSIFFGVIAPVFLLVIVGYVGGPRLQLEARTLSRFAFYILVPSFIFNVISSAEINTSQLLQMIGLATLGHLAIALVALIVARLLGHSAEMVAAYVIIVIFGNVGNFGLPIIEFRLGSEAIAAATVYFLVILTVSFVVCVIAANWSRGGWANALWATLKTPALIAVVPAALVNWLNLPVPLFIDRAAGLLGSGMVPTMLVVLGVQLADMKNIHFNRDVIIASGLRLIGSPLLAILLVGFFNLSEIERGAGIFQAGMPAAVLTSIMALEYDLRPDFVTTTVLFTTLASVITLTILLAIV